jgi:hypothetical protein
VDDIKPTMMGRVKGRTRIVTSTGGMQIPLGCPVGRSRLPSSAVLSRMTVDLLNTAATFVQVQVSAQYILSEGNRRVILCERGIAPPGQRPRSTWTSSAVPGATGMTPCRSSWS